MTRAQIRAMIRYYLREKTEQYHEDTIVSSLITEGELDVAMKTRCLRTSVLDSTVAAQVAYAWPVDALFISRLQWKNSSGNFKTIAPLDSTCRGLSVVNETEPVWWPDAPGRTFWIVPIPTTSGSSNLRVHYIKRPVVMTIDTETPAVPVHLHMLIAKWAAWQGCIGDGDIERASYFESMYTREIATAKIDADEHFVIGREEPAREYEDYEHEEFGG